MTATSELKTCLSLLTAVAWYQLTSNVLDSGRAAVYLYLCMLKLCLCSLLIRINLSISMCHCLAVASSYLSSLSIALQDFVFVCQLLSDSSKEQGTVGTSNYRHQGTSLAAKQYNIKSRNNNSNTNCSTRKQRTLITVTVLGNKSFANTTGLL